MAQKLGQQPVQTPEEGYATSLPAGMITDEYGMAGLLASIRAARTDPDQAPLTLGIDLDTLGIDMDSPHSLHQSFQGPFAEPPRSLYYADSRIPVEYMLDQDTRAKVAEFKVERYGEDVLFFIFYTFGGDARQIESAVELHKRGWRFHKDEGVWIRLKGGSPTEVTRTYQRGKYPFFDPVSWKKAEKEFIIDNDKIELKPPTIVLDTSATREPTAPGEENPE